MTHHLTRMDSQIVCKFCERLCNHGQQQGKKNWWHCDHCHLSYLITKKQNVHIYEFRTTLNDKQYIINIYPITSLTQICIWNNTQNYFASEKLIKSFDSVLDISPQNITDKLKTILTFL
jgi:hypothetical protein